VNTIHPTAIIGPEVTLGTGNTIGPYSVIEGRVTIGDHNWIGPHVVIGMPGEMRGTHHYSPWAGETSDSAIVIGSHNVLREFTVVQQGSIRDTRIGSDCYIMDKVHVPHDAIICDGATLSAGAMIAGHVIVCPGANVGLASCIHQYAVIGAGAMVGMGAVVNRNIPPHAIAYGSPARVQRANEVGLRRKGVTDELIEAIDATLRAADIDALRRLVPTDTALYEAAIAANTAPGSKLPVGLLVGSLQGPDRAPALADTQR
jgi:UDP-N-acetylglucosamine acyltransferase